ncbi:MAG: transglycosylase domain-containing protein [Chitinispirillaceae bacterium]|nr:transglycosylase domain-containing protein [Chitinispirillaceae bacterium]
MVIPPVQPLLSRPRTDRAAVRTVLICVTAAAALYLNVALFAALLSLRYRLPPPSLMMVDRRHRFIATVQNSDSLFGFWPLPETLPVKAVALAIAAEDRRFHSHPGIDPVAFCRAAYTNLFTRQQFSGASTIAMQVARLQGRHNRTLFHKIEESFTAVLLTLFQGREAVLRRYLTIAPYGNRITGINYAARRYFKKPLQDLTWAETALLTALPNAPGLMNLYRPSGVKRAFKRAKYILKRARDYGMIDSLVCSEAFVELDHCNLPGKERRPGNMLHAIHAARENLTRRSPPLRLNPANPTVRLSLDCDLQDTVSEIAMKYLDDIRDKNAGNCAVLVIERTTGEILVYHGSDYYFDSYEAGSIDYIQTPRSTGSLLKPFIYAFGMEWNGYTAATLLTDAGLFFGDGKNPYITHNFDHHYLGPVLYQTALANSRNVPAIQVLQDVGLEMAYNKLAQLSLAPDDGRAEYYGLGLAVGNLYASLLRLCTAYLALANEGKKRTPQWLYHSPVIEPDTQLIPGDICRQMQNILSDPQARLPSFPRGSYLEYPFPVAVKTGTSRGFRDAWTIGWSDTYLVGVWIGRHDNQSMKEVSGFSGAAPLVQQIFMYLHADRKQGLENSGFPPPGEYRPFRIDNLTGELAGKHSPYTSTIYFKLGTEPVTESNIYRWVTVDKRNHLLASPWCSPKYTELRRMFFLPAIFKDWAEKQGLALAPTRHSPLCGGVEPEERFTVKILMPRHESRLYIDPEMPAGENILMLNCQVQPRVKEVLWFVDGLEYRVAVYPYRTPWPIQKGRHRFMAQVPYTKFTSNVVEVEVF